MFLWLMLRETGGGKGIFGMKLSYIHQNEMDVLAGDMNGHVGSTNAGYDGMHNGLGMKTGS